MSKSSDSDKGCIMLLDEKGVRNEEDNSEENQ